MYFFSRALRVATSNVKRTWKPPNYITSYSFCSTLANLLPPPPKVQGKAPSFKGMAVVDQDFKEIKLEDFSGKYLVFYFYPLDFTFVCPTEIIAFSELYEEFKKTNTEVVACSCDSHFSHLAWKNTPKKAGGIGDIKYPLLSDYTKAIARNYGLLIETSGIALRGLFIIDGNGIIRHMSVNDLPVGRSVEEVLRLVKAFQFNDKHGEGIQISHANISDIQTEEKEPQAVEIPQQIIPDKSEPESVVLPRKRSLKKLVKNQLIGSKFEKTKDRDKKGKEN